MASKFQGSKLKTPAPLPEGRVGAKAKFLGVPAKEQIFTEEQLAEQAFEKAIKDAQAEKPWSERTTIAVDDLIRKFADGASYGGLDRMLGEDEIRKTNESSIRSGSLGTAAEIAGAVASPLTRAIGGIAKFATSPVSKPFVQKTLQGALEGGAATAAYDTISDTGNIAQDSAQGAAVGASVPALLKALGFTGKSIAGLLAGVEPKHYSSAFKLGNESSEAAKALKSVMESDAPTALDDAVNKGRLAFAGTPVGPNDESIGATITEVMNKRMSNSGIYAGTSEDEKALKKLFAKTTDKQGNNKLRSVEDILAFRQGLGEFTRKPQFNIGADAKDVEKAVDITGKKAGGEAYEKVAKDIDTLNEARTAGGALRKANPNIINSPGLLATVLAGATGMSMAGIPITAPVLAGAVATLLASSPKFTGAAARKAGVAARTANKILPMTSGRVGLVDLVAKDKEKRRRNRGQE